MHVCDRYMCMNFVLHCCQRGVFCDSAKNVTYLCVEWNQSLILFVISECKTPSKRIFVLKSTLDSLHQSSKMPSPEKMKALEAFVNYLMEVRAFVVDNLNPSLLSLSYQLVYRKAYCQKIADFNVKLDRYRSDFHLELNINKEIQRDEDLRDLKCSFTSLMNLFTQAKAEDMVSY